MVDKGDAVVTDEERVARYLEKVMDSAVAAVGDAGSGGRSTTLSTESFRVGILVGAGALPASTATQLLLNATSGWANDQDWTSKRIEDHIRRGLKGGTERGSLRAVLPGFARDWTQVQVCAAAAHAAWPRPTEEQVAAWASSAKSSAAEEDALRQRAAARVEQMDLLRMSRWALQQDGYPASTPQAFVGRELEMLRRLSGPRLEMARLAMRGISPEVIASAALGRALWPVMESEKFPGRALRTTRALLIPWWKGEGGHRHEVDAIQFQFEKGVEPKYRWLEDMGGGILYGAERLGEAAGRGLVIVEGALCVLRVRSEPRFPHTVVGLPHEGGWRRAYSRYGGLIDQAERIWVIPDAVPEGSKSKAREYAVQFVDALGEKARVVALPSDLDVDDWLNADTGNSERLLAELDRAFEFV